MSFLVVFNGQFAPITYADHSTRHINPISLPERVKDIHEFKQILDSADEFPQQRPNSQLQIYSKAVKSFENQKARIYARDIMSSPVKTIHESATTKEAREVLIQLGLRHLPVIDQNNVIQGMITDRELLGSLSGQTCSEVMLKKLIVCEQQASLNEVAIILLNEKINALPVVNNQHKLTGIITMSDILAFVVKTTNYLGRG